LPGTDLKKIDEDLKENRLSREIIGACIEVHKIPGPGLLESAYEECLCRELYLREINFERQKSLSIKYKGINLDCGYRLDMVVDNCVILELKSVEKVLPIHEAQLISYLKLSGIKLGLLINFNVIKMKDGIKRIVLEL